MVITELLAAGMERIFAGGEALASRNAHGRRDVGILENHRPAREPVHVRSATDRIPHEPGQIEPKFVRHQDEDVPIHAERSIEPQIVG